MSHRGRGVLGVIPEFDRIYTKFGMEVKYDVLKDFPKFGCNQNYKVFLNAK